MLCETVYLIPSSKTLRRISSNGYSLGSARPQVSAKRHFSAKHFTAPSETEKKIVAFLVPNFSLELSTAIVF